MRVGFKILSLKMRKLYILVKDNVNIVDLKSTFGGLKNGKK